MKQIIFTKNDHSVIEEAFASGIPVVMPTDTIYGVTVPALEKKSVMKLYRLRKRNPNKPFIILISSLKDLALFDIFLDEEKKEYLKGFWPGEVTAILDCPQKEFYYLHRGTKALAFRVPKDKELIRLLKKTGPLVAPSANIEGMPEAKNIADAHGYFKEKAVYIDKGVIKGLPSTIISLANNKFEIIRKGSYKMNKNEYFRSSINN
ncbi:MAG: L-threonylcarbamoyladenylate synthase [Candidatus Pacebacteria bacterium]|nr:L-threonylcarbamoyladenylate synthase [Candidatus Paceibacterota bacterium]